jgi:capsular exopolysaccharide synthesis family protein
LNDDRKALDGSRSTIKSEKSMSRLFEALSDAQAKRRSPGVVALKMPPTGVVRPEGTAVEAAPSEPAQELEREQRSPDDVPLAIASTDVVPLVIAVVNAVPPKPAQKGKILKEVLPKPVETLEARSVPVKVLPESRLVALTDPNSLGAEKFRALVTRLDYLRKQRELKSFQVTSSVINEGKTVVAGNVAVTLAKYSGSKTLLIEGDLHRPSLAALLGLSELDGVSQWWSGKDQELAEFVHRLNHMPLWFLSAGRPCDRPSDILRSPRFEKAFTQLASQFEWIVVDSTPMLPIADVNLWSRLVDGTLLVVREGRAPIKALKKGLQALDHPKLIGVVMNDVSESDQANYDGQYYGLGRHQAVEGLPDKMS